MSSPRGTPPDDLGFRSLAAPGLDEDDLFAAIHGLPGAGGLWGDGRPWSTGPPDVPWSEDAERRRRHEEMLGKWTPCDSADGGGALSDGAGPS